MQSSREKNFPEFISPDEGADFFPWKKFRQSVRITYDKFQKCGDQTHPCEAPTRPRASARSRFHRRMAMHVREIGSPAGSSPPQVVATSYREQLQAALANVVLPGSVSHGGPDFFFKQGWEHERRKARFPSQRGGLVRGLPRETIGPRYGQFSECFPEQPGFEPFQFSFLSCAESRRRSRIDFKVRLRIEPGRQYSFLCVHAVAFFLARRLAGRGSKQKTRD